MMTEVRRKYDFDRVVRIVFTAICVGAALYLINYLSGVLLPFLLACLLAYMIHPLVEFNKKVLHLKKDSVPAVLALFEVVLGIALVLSLLLPYIYDEISNMVVLLGEYTTKRFNVNYLPKELHNYILKWIHVDQITDMLSKEQWMKLVSDVFERTWSFLGATASVIANAFSWLVSILYLIFILIDYDKINEGMQKAVPKQYNAGVFMVLNDVKNSMNMYFRGQSLIALIVGILFAIGFSIIGLPLAVVLGLFIGLLNMVPYLQLISIPVAIFLCLVDAVATGSNFWTMCAWTGVVYCVVQAIQDLVLTPKIMGKYMAINPVFILLSLSIWGSLLGFIGLIIALPLTALIVAYYKRYVLNIGVPSVGEDEGDADGAADDDEADDAVEVTPED